MNIILVKPSKEYESLILEMLLEWKEYNLTHDDANKTPWAIFREYETFDDYLNLFKDDLDETKLKEGIVPSSTFFALDLDDNRMVGAINIRHYLNESLRNGGGHIGDGVRPSARGKGLGKELVRLAVNECHKLGINEIMMSCHSYNTASRKCIIANGGQYEKTIDDDGEPLEIYWIK